MKLDEATWAEIRRCVEETTETYASLEQRFGINTSTITRRRDKEVWGARPLSQTNHRQRVAQLGCAVLAGARRQHRAPDAPEVRVARLYRLIDVQLDNLETLMTTADPQSAEDQARVTRSFGTLVGNLEKVADIAAGMTQAAEAAHGDKRGDAYLKAEQLRREIAERLERLNAQWQAHAKPE